MIFDCTIFNGEFPLLGIRLAELMYMNVVHIIVESNRTFTGLRKDFLFDKDEYPLHSIGYHQIHNTDLGNPWKNEEYTRNCLKEKLKEYSPNDDDIVIISDMDEIARASVIRQYRPSYGLCSLQMDQMYYYLNVLDTRQTWRHPKIMTWEYLKDRQPNDVRNSGCALAMLDAGHHFSYMGGVDAMLDKFKSFSHQEPEVQRVANRDILENKIKNLENLWYDDRKLTVIDKDELPLYAQDLNHMMYVR